MRDLLIPIFGEWGAVVAQFLITVVIVLGLIGAVWWLMRRYSGVRFGGIGRGRVPRLAVVDVLGVDRRRRLVLVRRDNVEHLLLIGGPSDLLVEGAIQRVRQRSAQAAAQAAAARAAMQSAIEPPPTAEPEMPAEAMSPQEPPDVAPIPFPVARSARPQAAAKPAAAAPAATAAFVEPQRATWLHPLRGRQAAAPPPEALPPEEPLPEEQAPQQAADELFLSEVMTAESEAPMPPAFEPPATFAEAEREAAEEARQSALDLGEEPVIGEDEGEAPATAPGHEAAVQPHAEVPAAAPAGSPAKVSDLEREMARLLDEITTRRST